MMLSVAAFPVCCNIQTGGTKQKMQLLKYSNLVATNQYLKFQKINVKFFITFWVFSRKSPKKHFRLVFCAGI